jgi:hypothetical protein
MGSAHAHGLDHNHASIEDAVKNREKRLTLTGASRNQCRQLIELGAFVAALCPYDKTAAQPKLCATANRVLLSLAEILGPGGSVAICADLAAL